MLLKAASYGRILLQIFMIGDRSGAQEKNEKEVDHDLTRVCKLLRVAY